MIAQTFQLPCTKRAERILALTFMLAPDTLISVAHRLVSGENEQVVLLAKALNSIAVERARELSLKTLSDAGIAL